MATNAVGLEDLVGAMPHAAAVLDRRGAVVAANGSWSALAPDLAGVFPAASLIGHITVSGLTGASPEGEHHADPVNPLIDVRLTPAEAIRAVIAGQLAETVEQLRLRPLDAADQHGADVAERLVEVRVASVGVGGDFVLATCAEVLDLPVAADANVLDRHPVTALPGRRLFVELLSQAMTMSDRHRYNPAVLAVGVKGLDEIEQLHGLPARHELTVAVAARLQAGLRPGDVVAHTGDNEFMIMLPDVDGAYLAEAVSYRLGAEVERPFRLAGGRAEVQLSVGVATAEASRRPEWVLSTADEALTEARVLSEAAGERQIVVATPAGVVPRNSGRSAARHIDVAELREEELISYFQPIFDITDRRVVAGEALMRWRHPHYGVLSAGEFLGLAINSGLLATLTDQALVRSTETWADLRDRLGEHPPQLFVNLSPDQLLSRVAVDRLYHLLIATGLPPEDVVVEVTEEAMSTRFGEMLAVLTELRVHGLRVALDDFGSGYSSLGRLRHLPVDVIKVDQSMVRGLEADRRARQLLSAVATMANELDVECIVEGIETAGEASIVSDLGFRYVQGYHFARPCPADEFAGIVTPQAVVLG